MGVKKSAARAIDGTQRAAYGGRGPGGKGTRSSGIWAPGSGGAQGEVRGELFSFRFFDPVARFKLRDMGTPSGRPGCHGNQARSQKVGIRRASGRVAGTSALLGHQESPAAGPHGARQAWPRPRALAKPAEILGSPRFWSDSNELRNFRPFLHFCRHFHGF